MNLRTVMIGLSVVALAIVVVEWMSGTADGTHDLWFTCAFLVSSTVFALGGHFMPLPEQPEFAECCDEPDIHFGAFLVNKRRRGSFVHCVQCKDQGDVAPTPWQALMSWNADRGEQ